MRTALLLILVLGTAGLAFSGYLSYGELFANTGASCPSPGEPGTVLGYPACIYGFFMYLAVVIVAVIGLARSRTRSA